MSIFFCFPFKIFLSYKHKIPSYKQLTYLHVGWGTECSLQGQKIGKAFSIHSTRGLDDIDLVVCTHISVVYFGNTLPGHLIFYEQLHSLQLLSWIHYSLMWNNKNPKDGCWLIQFFQILYIIMNELWTQFDYIFLNFRIHQQLVKISINRP